MKRDSCIFYRSFYESIRQLPLEDQAVVYDAIFQFSFDFNEPDLRGTPKAIFEIIKPLIVSNPGENVKDLYISQGHLSITWDEMNKLIDEYGEEKSKEYIEKVLNYRKNSKYKSLYLTANNWLRRDRKAVGKSKLAI